MSHYSKVHTLIKNKNHLIKALIALGFKEHMIECFEEAQPLKGYRGDNRQQTAHIRIKGHGWGSQQNYVGGLSNDLGFEKMADGTYLFHVSDYDSSKYGSKWQACLLQQYSKQVVIEELEANSFYITEEEVLKNGSLHLVLMN